MLDFERMLKEEPEVVEEMKKLRDYLDKHKIEWEDVSEKGFPICRTHFMWGGKKWSVINGYGTYGGFGLLGEKNKGLLELWAEQVNDGTPLGYLTADAVINLMEKA